MKRKLVKRVAIGSGLILLLLLLLRTAVAVSLFIGEEWLEWRITRAINQSETIKVDDFDLNLWPPGLRFEDIVISYSDGSADEQSLSADLVEIRTSIDSWIDGSLEIEEVHLKGLSASYIRDAQGGEN